MHLVKRGARERDLRREAFYTHAIVAADVREDVAAAPNAGSQVLKVIPTHFFTADKRRHVTRTLYFVCHRSRRRDAPSAQGAIH